MSPKNSVAVCVPAIPNRLDLQGEALASVLRQTRPPAELHVSTDYEGLGAAQNRNKTWRSATTEWVAFLDDDDVLYADHLEWLLAHSEGADLVYPWFDLFEGVDPLFVHHNGKLVSPLGVPFGDEAKSHIKTHGNFIPITVLVRRELLLDIGGFPQPGTEEWPHETCEDWGCWQKMLNAGATFVHAPKRTWRWRWHYGNTSGKPWNK